MIVHGAKSLTTTMHTDNVGGGEGRGGGQQIIARLSWFCLHTNTSVCVRTHNRQTAFVTPDGAENQQTPQRVPAWPRAGA